MSLCITFWFLVFVNACRVMVGVLGEVGIIAGVWEGGSSCCMLVGRRVDVACFCMLGGVVVACWLVGEGDEGLQML